MGDDLLTATTPRAFSWREIAEMAYQAYAAVTDNKNYQGLPMPKFADLPVKIQTAWEAAVRHAWNVNVVGVTFDLTPEERERMLAPSRWTGWVPPHMR